MSEQRVSISANDQGIWDNENAAPGCVNTEEPLTRSLDLGEEGLAMKATRTCSIEGCERAHYGRGWCHMHWQRWRKNGDPLLLVAYRRPAQCEVVGCESAANGGNGWCLKHYTRWRRYGSPLGSTIRRRGISAEHGYLILHRPGHPLADSYGRVYEHRLVLYAVLGPDPQPCHWCSDELAWGINLHVDHVDENRQNNTPSNLVPSCQKCNVIRPKAAT